MKQVINEELSRVKKELYLNAAARYFDEVGYKEFKISDLAKELETSVGTIYNLFDSKEKLYVQYLVLKLEIFLGNLKENEGSDPLENLRVYLEYKYAKYITNEPTTTNDSYFFHKLEILNHKVVDEIYQYLTRQLRLLLPYENTNHEHLAILFKKLSDGFIVSHFSGQCSSEQIVDKTLDIFLNGAKQ
ncbi:TetR/AcrR family transcriptional regulator [Sulfurimonas aquatica]|uniref:TetR/AcrR family transcriptional regulator n=1 Tax=Sulfurimonas aquatica TaxID=2672570 RepID=UPI001A98CBA9|nr:TetR/AcrR family transcriptional regulator [Sulfurimonas aquatica]